MKVKELMELLKEEEDPDREVIMSKDGEGNNFSPLSDFRHSIYVPENSYSGSIYIDELTEKRKKAGFTEDDLAPEGETQIKALVLWPIN